MKPNLFIDIIQVSLGNRDKLSWEPSAAKWELLFAESVRQSVVNVLVDGLERLPSASQLPMPLLVKWMAQSQKNEVAYRRHCQCARILTERFRAAGLPTCVLKGVATAQLYPHPERRICGDIDFWVQGDRREIMQLLRAEYELEHVEWHHIGIRAFDDVPVEVHVLPGWLYNPWCNRRLQRFFRENGTPHEVGSLGFNAASARFEAVFSLVHTFHHLLEEGVGLRHVIDYYYICKACRAAGDDTAREVMQAIRSVGLGKFAAAMMWVLREVCGMPAAELLCEPNEAEGRFLQREIMAGGDFGKTRTDGMLRNTLGRWWMVLRHYPSEVLWMVPWKLWHWFWRAANR